MHSVRSLSHFCCLTDQLGNLLHLKMTSRKAMVILVEKPFDPRRLAHLHQLQPPVPVLRRWASDVQGGNINQGALDACIVSRDAHHSISHEEPTVCKLPDLQSRQFLLDLRRIVVRVSFPCPLPDCNEHNFPLMFWCSKLCCSRHDSRTRESGSHSSCVCL